MKDELIKTQPVVNGTNTQPVDNGANTQPVVNGNGSEEKMFSQREVTEIVRNRLERERAKLQPQEPNEAELKQRELDERESRITCKEYLLDSGYPLELLDVLDTSNPEAFMDKCLTVVGMIRKAKEPAPMFESSYGVETGPDAFARTTKHSPRQYGIF